MSSAKGNSDNSGDDKLVRLSKRMSELGLCSRREADVYIERGLVRVNGKIVNVLGTKVDPSARIELLPQAQKQQSQLVTVILNKPIGYVSHLAEPGYTPAIRLVTLENFFGDEPPPDHIPRLSDLAVAGRLDIESQGLLVFTQDGRISRHLVGEDSPVEKEYLVRVRGELAPRSMDLLRFGLELDGQPLKPAIIEWVNEDQLRFVLTEGKKRQIRRMCDQVGLEVLGLKRVRVGKLRLGRLPEGKWRLLGPEEEI